jgi:hypothetical protein
MEKRTVNSMERSTKKGTREMKDTITLAELRKTELYRKEQTRPLREFLMENIDVLKLADEIEMWGEDLLALNMRGGIPVIEGAKMLRQQQAEIEELKTCLIVEQEHNERMVEDRSKYEALAHAGGVEAGKELKELTDEEIDMLVHEYNCIDDYPHEFVRACIRKAQEK